MYMKKLRASDWPERVIFHVTQVQSYNMSVKLWN